MDSKKRKKKKIIVGFIRGEEKSSPSVPVLTVQENKLYAHRHTTPHRRGQTWEDYSD